MHDVTKSNMGKRYIQNTKKIPMHFNVTKYKMSIDKVFDSSLKLKELQSVET